MKKSRIEFKRDELDNRVCFHVRVEVRGKVETCLGCGRERVREVDRGPKKNFEPQKKGRRVGEENGGSGRD